MPSSVKSNLFQSRQSLNLILSLLLAVATLALYNPANSHPFVNYDDDRYITGNAHVRGGLSLSTISWAFTSIEQSNWHPLTWISHALDCQLFHLNPAGHHFTSILLHTLNAVLLFLLLVRATGNLGPSLFVAALFALHPINVESVAWIAERKNVLCTLFSFLSLGAYGWYALKPSTSRYLAVASLFAAALMSKPMAVTLPCALLLLDYWPLGRIRGSEPPVLKTIPTPFLRLVLEKLPLLSLSAASAVITMHAQRAGGAMRSTLQFSLGVRIQNAIFAYAMYLWKTLWPAHLAPLYPHPGDSLRAWQLAVAAAVLTAITLLVVRFRERGYLVTGWLWFLGTLVPVLGLVQVGDQAMADRYAYVPLLGIFVMLAWGAADLAARLQARTALVAPALFVVAVLAFATHTQISYWGSNYNLWSHAVAVTDRNFIAQDNLGGALILEGKEDEAFQHFQLASAINPKDPMSHFNLGAYLQNRDRLEEAIAQYQTSIGLTSDAGLLASAYANLGAAYRELSDDARARESFEQALQYNPSQFNAYFGLGILEEKQGRLEEAINDYSRSIDLQPTSDGCVRLGHALAAAGRITEAREAYAQALRITPELPEAVQALDRLSGGTR